MADAKYRLNALLQVEGVIAAYQAAFAAGGAHLSLQRAQHSYWIQVDVDPSLAVGKPGGWIWGACWGGGIA
jgi:hypothetical protein